MKDFQGEAGTGNVAEAVKHARQLFLQIEDLKKLTVEEKRCYAERIGVSESLLDTTIKLGRLPVVTFAAGGIATPADAALMMQLGMDGVFVGSGIFKSSHPLERARAIVKSVALFNDSEVLAKESYGIGEAMQ